MIIKNVWTYMPEGKFEKKNVVIKDGFFDDITSEKNLVNDKLEKGEMIIDGKEGYLIPGLTDIHFHGCNGYDFCDASKMALQAMCEYEASNGVTTIVPATMTLEEERLSAIVKNASEYSSDKDAKICGIHLEGPFLSEKKKGAQDDKDLKNPDNDMLERLMKASDGLIKIVDLAPELDGAFGFIEKNKERVVLSLAHSDADFEKASLAFEKGICHVTHLYNAMQPIHHRAPGPVMAAADREDVTVELICDGIHVHPAVVRNTMKLFGEDRVVFVSDSMRAAGLKDGSYDLGGQEVSVNGKIATLGDGTLAGSCTNLMGCMITAVKEMQIPLETAVKCAAVNPAKRVGIYDRYGSIEAGKVANVVLLRKEDLSIRQVILKGEIYEKEL